MSSGQALRESFVTHVLQTAGMDDEVIDKIIVTGRVNSIQKLKLLDPDSLTYMADNLDLAVGDLVTLRAIQTWLDNYKKGDTPGGNTMPSTLEGWQEKFTEESFVKYTTPQEQKVKPAPYTTPAKVSSVPVSSGAQNVLSSPNTTTSEGKPKSRMSVKLSDYPRFSGRTRDWYGFYLKFQAVSICAQTSYLLHISDFNDHDATLISNEFYRDDNENLFAVLLNCTTGGDAQPLITRYQGTFDGARAWNTLLERFHTEGNIQVQAQECLQGILSLELEHNTPGGLDHLLSRFETLNQQLAQTGTANCLTDTLKKTILLFSIKDKVYGPTKDLCAYKDLEQTINALRGKAREMGIINGPRSKFSSNNMVSAKEQKPEQKGKGSSTKKKNYRGRSRSRGNSRPPRPGEPWRRFSPTNNYEKGANGPPWGNRGASLPRSSQNIETKQENISERKVNMAKAEGKPPESVRAMAKPVKALAKDPKGESTTKELTILDMPSAKIMSKNHGGKIKGPSMMFDGEKQITTKGNNDDTDITALSNYVVGNIWRPLSPDDLAPCGSDSHMSNKSLSTGAVKTQSTARLNLKKMVRTIKRKSAVENARARIAERADLAKHTEKVVGPHFTALARFIEQKPLAVQTHSPEPSALLVRDYTCGDLPNRVAGASGVGCIVPDNVSRTTTSKKFFTMDEARAKFPFALLMFCLVNGLIVRPEWAWVREYILINPTARGQTIPELKNWALAFKAEEDRRKAITNARVQNLKKARMAT